MKWVSADDEAVRAKLRLVKARVVGCKTKEYAKHMHFACVVWVAESHGKYYVLQADATVDLHRVVAVVTSNIVAYLCRGQVEALLEVASDPNASNHRYIRKAVRACGLRLPPKKKGNRRS